MNPFTKGEIPLFLADYVLMGYGTGAIMDRLPSREKAVLQAASVIGTDVPLGLLQAIVEIPEDELQGQVGHLQVAEFLYETRFFPDVEYTFKHALTHAPGR